MSPKSTAIFVFYLLFITGGFFAFGWFADGYFQLGGNIMAFTGLAAGAFAGVFIGAQQAWANEAMEYIKLNINIEVDEILDSLEREGDKDN